MKGVGGEVGAQAVIRNKADKTASRPRLVLKRF
jgi:hypothetical protein